MSLKCAACGSEPNWPIGCEICKPIKPNKNILCEEAIAITQGERRKSYGPIEESAQRRAQALTAYFKPKLKEGVKITAEDAMLIEVIGKVMRASVEHKKDNYVDIIGYTILADQVKEIK